MKYPARIISLHLSATHHSGGPFFMYFSILYEETATCLGDLKFYSLFVGYTEPSYFEDASDIWTKLLKR